MEMPFPQPGEARSWPRSLPRPARRCQELLLGAIAVAESGCVWLQKSLSWWSYPGGREGGRFRQLLVGWPGCRLNEESRREGSPSRGPRGLLWRASVNRSPLGLSSSSSPLWAVIIAAPPGQNDRITPHSWGCWGEDATADRGTLCSNLPFACTFLRWELASLGIGGTAPSCPPGARRAALCLQRGGKTRLFHT